MQGEETYKAHYSFNDPYDTNGIIYARDMGSRNFLLAEKFPGHRYFISDKQYIREVSIDMLRDFFHGDVISPSMLFIEDISLPDRLTFISLTYMSRSKYQLLCNFDKEGDYIVADLRVPPQLCNVEMHFSRSKESGIVEVQIDETRQIIDLYGPSNTEAMLLFNNVMIPHGRCKIKIEVIGRNPNSKGYHFSLSRIKLLER